MFRAALLCLGLFVPSLIAPSSQAQMVSVLDHHVVIHNYTSQTLVSFYASRVELSSWEEDIFHASVLPAGNSVTINIDDGSGYCLYDFKAVFSSGKVLRSEKAINVCLESSYTYFNKK